MAQSLLSLRRDVEHVANLTCLESKVERDVPYPGYETKGHDLTQRFNNLEDFVSQDSGGKLPEKPPFLCVNHKQKQESSGHMGATLKCIECGVNYCVVCIEVHKVIPVTASHHVIDLEGDCTETQKSSLWRQADHEWSPQRIDALVPMSKPTLIQSVKAEGKVQYMTLFRKRIVTITWDGNKEQRLQLSMHPKNDPLARKVEQMTKVTIPYVCCVACVYHDGIHKLAMTNQTVPEGIILLSPEDGTVEDLSPTRHQAVGAMGVSVNNTMVYCDARIPISIKMIENMTTCTTVVQNSIDNKVLLTPIPCVDSQDNVIIADMSAHTVTKYTKDGRIIFTYSNFDVPVEKKDPHRICVDDYDNIYVTIRQQNRILRLDPNGQFKGYILSADDGISGPGALHYEHPNLYVGQDNGEIKIFQIY